MKEEKERGREQKQSGPAGTGQLSGLRAFRPTCCLVLGKLFGFSEPPFHFFLFIFNFCLR